MSRTLVALIALLLMAPLVAAANPEPELPAAEVPELDAETVTLSERLAPIGDAASSAGHALAGAASAAGAFAGAAVSALVDGVAWLAAGIGAAFVFVANGLVWLAFAIGGALASAFHFLAGAAAALGGLLAGAASALGALLARGAKAAVEHPRETAVVAASATGAGGLLWALKRFGFLAGLPLYTRLMPGEMLDNEARASVYEHIRAHPAAHPSQIAEALGLGWGTVVYHLSRLEEGKLVTRKSYNNRKCYFATGTSLDAEARTAVAAMGSDPARRIVEAVAAAPGITQKDLAQTLGMSQALASWHVKRLAGSGILLTAREGRSNTLRVAAHVPLASAAAVVVA